MLVYAGNNQGEVYAYQHSGQWFPTDTLEKYEEASKEYINVE